MTCTTGYSHTCMFDHLFLYTIHSGQDVTLQAPPGWWACPPLGSCGGPTQQGGVALHQRQHSLVVGTHRVRGLRTLRGGGDAGCDGVIHCSLCLSMECVGITTHYYSIYTCCWYAVLPKLKFSVSGRKPWTIVRRYYQISLRPQNSSLEYARKLKLVAFCTLTYPVRWYTVFPKLKNSVSGRKPWSGILTEIGVIFCGPFTLHWKEYTKLTFEGAYTYMYSTCRAPVCVGAYTYMYSKCMY